MKKLYILAIITIFFTSLFALNQVDNFKVWDTGQEGVYRITLDCKESPDIKELNSGSKKYLILNIKDSIFKKSSESFRMKHHGIEYFKLVQFDKKTVRLVAKITKEYQTKFLIMQKNSSFPYRIIIDYKQKDIACDIAPGLPTIVIDPGHGGKDSGAIGTKGTYEKDIVLDIAKQLEKKLWQSGRVNPVLTREDDTFVGLRNRVSLTENKNAVLFLSIHNNAEPTGRARGYRVYVLDENGKSGKTHDIVASAENKSFEMFEDINDVKKMDKNVLGILADIKLNQTIAKSMRLGNLVIDSFKNEFSNVDIEIRRAPFHVLKLAGIPGVLFEAGFITNKYDERLLKNVFYREKVAEVLKRSIMSYLTDNKLIACELESNNLPEYYKVKPGDTLIHIAKRFSIDLKKLQKVNNIENPSRIMVGMKLRIVE